MNESKMKMPLRMGALPDDIEQMRRIREERQSGRDLPLNMRSMPDDARRDRDASRDLPLNMGSLPDDAGRAVDVILRERSGAAVPSDEQLREMDSGSPFVMRADRLLKMGVPVDLIRIVDEHLGDIPFNSEQELRAIDQILNMYSHLLESGSAVPNEEMMRMESGSAISDEEMMRMKERTEMSPKEIQLQYKDYSGLEDPMERAD